MKIISWSDFEKVELRIGTILKAEEFPEANKPAYKLTIDFGPEIGIKRSSAQITNLYNLDDLNGKQILAVVNFQAKQIGPFMSECLVTGVKASNETTNIVLLSPDLKVENGTKLI